jgi:uncharacterized protein (TIGR02246 family)
MIPTTTAITTAVAVLLLIGAATAFTALHIPPTGTSVGRRTPSFGSASNAVGGRPRPRRRPRRLELHIRHQQAGSDSLEYLPGPNDVSENDICNLFSLWNNALATCQSQIVAKRYARDAVLLPAISDEPRMDYDSIKNYYDTFLLKRPQKEVLERRITRGVGWAQDVGICVVTLRAERSTRFRARYSFLYVWEDKQWRIKHHHSSVMPEETPPNEMTVDRVRNLFHLWNDSLDTLNADTVARRFTKNAVVLPTISNIPRTDYESIRAYYEEFLKYKPQARIVQSHVTIGSDSARDVGTYELTLGVDGTKVMSRYSFDYAYEAGRWLISHQHSSPMPENNWKTTGVGKDCYGPSSSATRISEEAVRELFGKWRDALATLDSQQVAERYTRDGVLMPTVSATPRTGRAAIKEFYDSFVLNKPQVKVLQSFVTVNENWCKDLGVCEFRLGTRGATIQERYSFLYILEDGEWKIAHHHSSALPEGLQVAARKASGEDGDDPNWQ